MIIHFGLGFWKKPSSYWGTTWYHHGNPHDPVSPPEARDFAPFGPSRSRAAAAGPADAATLGAGRDVPVVHGERRRVFGEFLVRHPSDVGLSLSTVVISSQDIPRAFSRRSHNTVVNQRIWGYNRAMDGFAWNCMLQKSLLGVRSSNGSLCVLDCAHCGAVLTLMSLAQPPNCSCCGVVLIL
jgi:hypothetical protein